MERISLSTRCPSEDKKYTTYRNMTLEVESSVYSIVLYTCIPYHFQVFEINQIFSHLIYAGMESVTNPEPE